MNYITINNRRKRVDEILEFEEASELDDNVTMLVQEAYINDKIVAGRLIYDIRNKKSDYDWELLGAAE
jgi:hypothetical protein